MDIFDTIAAISTPAGEGGIGIVRLSGPQALFIADRLFCSPRGKRPSEAASHTILHGFIRDPSSGAHVDEVLISVMRAPRTYTREDVVEINCHGGQLPLRRALELALGEGARLAQPGEFTKRAFLNGRIDLSQAEAVLDIIRAKSEEAGKVALAQLRGGLSEKINSARDRLMSVCAHIEAHLDFPEDEIERKTAEELFRETDDVRGELSRLLKTYEEGRLLREGLRAAIVGRPNVGKSSLLNALLGEERAIVTDTPGTTRDVIAEHITIGGFPLRVMDTAGIRESRDIVEKEGVRRSLQAIEDADLVICVLDQSAPLREEDFEVLWQIGSKGAKSITALNKSDLAASWSPQSYGLENFVRLSAKTGEGIEDLKRGIIGAFSGGLRAEAQSGAIITNLRHRLAIDQAKQGLDEALGAMASGMPLEIVSVGLRDALQALGAIVGAVSNDEILGRIFDEFCIGK